MTTSIFQNANKKGFTLFELIIVVFLLSIISGFILIKFDLFSSSTKQLTFKNLKSKLLENEFQNSISLKCTQDKICYLFIDETLQEEQIKLDISDDIEVYSYDNTLNQIFFKDLELEELQRYDVIFEFTINKDKKHKDMIVLNDEKIYIFNSIYKTPIVKSSLSDISEYFEQLKNKVKDSAF